MWPDNETSRDFINFTGVADTVAEIIHQAAGRPISIGISGAWGIGKSSMIKLIRHSVEQRDTAKPSKYIFVEFNAWLYQGYDDARAALMEVIAETLAKEAGARQTGVEKAKDLLKRVDWLRVAKFGVGTAASLALGFAPVGLAGEALQLVRRTIESGADEKTIGEAEAIAGKAKEATAGVFKPKKDSSPPKEIHALRKSFEDTLIEMDVRLVVLIDDLDRCLPETTISTLEAIRLFLFLERTAFVIAADEAMIKHAVKRHFDGIDDKLVTSYFDKLIQLPIPVPPLGTQEVRAYMMLLFIENSSLDSEVKEKLRAGVCKQLGQTWRGERVDRAFLKSLHAEIPADLFERLEVAERLAPVMTSATEIAGNPRLIKRFLNALSVRMAIAQSHGVTVDEAVLAKLLLFERCGTPLGYAALIKAVNEDPEGKPQFLTEWEEGIHLGTDLKLAAPWDEPFVREWLSLSPRLGDRDLRGALYVSREHAPLITPEDRLTPEGAGLLTALLAHPDVAGQTIEALKKLPRADTGILLDKLLDRARREQEWGVPPILEACLAVVEADSTLGTRLAAFLIGRPATQIKANIVPRIDQYQWTKSVFDAWAKAGVGTNVKRAIKERTGNGNLAV